MKINQLIPELLVEDMQKSLNFYQKILGFDIEVSFPKNNPVFVQIKKDDFQIMLYMRSDFEKEIPALKKVNIGGSFLLYFKASDIQKFFNSIKKKVKVIKSIHKTEYGSLEFLIEDCNGYYLAFSEEI